MKKYILLIILTVIVGALPCFVQYGDYLFWTDFSDQEIPFIMETKRMLASGHPWWSWNTYYGDNFVGCYSFYTLTSPFVWLLCLLPYSWLLKGIFVVVMLKYCCAFLTSRLFLRKMGVAAPTACVGGLLYAFSSYTISNTYYFHFFEPLIVFPLLLVAIERYLRRERYSCTLLLGASFLTVFINYYFAIGSFLAALMWVVCRLCSRSVKCSPQRFLIALVMIGLGVVLDAFILVPTALQLYGGPRIDGIKTYGFDTSAVRYFLERLRVLFMPQVAEGIVSNFNGSGYNANSVCLPLLGMFAAALHCWHHRRHWLTCLLLIALFFYLTPLNGIFTLFTTPKYTRWAYAFALFLILASCRWMDEGARGLSLRNAASYSAVAVGVFALVQGYTLLRSGMAVFSRAVFACYALALAVCLGGLLLYARLRSRRVLVLGICVCAAAQMSIFHLMRSDAYFSFMSRKPGEKHFYSGLVRTAIANNHVPIWQGPIHHRTAFPTRFANSALMLNRPSLSSFHSIQNNAIRRLLNVAEADTAKNKTVSFVRKMPNCNYRSFYALMSVKEVVAYDDSLFTFDWTLLNLEGGQRGDNYTIYNNRDYLPMGFTYDSYIEEDLIDTLNARTPKPDVPLQMLANLAVPKEEETFFDKHLRKGSLTPTENLDSLVRERRKCVSSSFIGTTTGFTSEITLPQENIVFYSVPADKGFTAYIDGQETDIHPCNLGLSAVLVPEGTHTVELRFLPRGLKAGASVSLAALLLSLGVGLRERKR